MEDQQDYINESASNFKGGPKPKGFSHPQPLLNMSLDKKLDPLPYPIANYETTQTCYPYYQDSMLTNQAYYWPPQWNQSYPYMRAMSASMTSLSCRDHNVALMKTKICDHWRRSGNCSYGDSCWYAHGEDDLRKVVRFQERKGNISQFFQNMYRSNRNIEDKLTGENERPYGSTTYRGVSNSMKDDPSTISKNSEAPPPSKRVSTNVKGLTVNIPPNIAFKEQTANASMPLSPAQERWISMSIGTQPSSTVAEKGNEPTITSSASAATIRNGLDNESEKKASMESVVDRRPGTARFFRDDDADDYGFLSPNPFTYPQSSVFSGGNPSQIASMSSHARSSFSRGPHQRNAMGQQFGGMSFPQSTVPTAPTGRPATLNNGFSDRQPFQLTKSIPTTRSAIVDMPKMTGGVPAQQQQPFHPAIWNVAGELYQRQKDIETCGIRGGGTVEQQNRDAEMARLLSKLNVKDLTYLRYILDNGIPNERDLARQTWNELINNGSQPNQQQPMPTQFMPNNNGLSSTDKNGSDCHCGHNTRRKLSHDSSAMLSSQFPQSHHHQSAVPQHFAQAQHHHHQQLQQHQQQFLQQAQQQQQMLRQHHHNVHYGNARFSAENELAAPPKIFESLLPSDENFSIWLDPKPRKDSNGGIPEADHSNSGDSLLAKMDVLRSQKCPITDEEMMMNRGADSKEVSEGKRSNSESSSPAVLSLMELLSSENLLDESTVPQKTTMFDFDTLKIAETLRSDPTLSGQSSEASSTQKSESPMFFLVDEKTPNYCDTGFQQSGLFTPATPLSTTTVQTPSFMEQCDFFAAAGSCPFGDGCHLSHSIPKDQQQQHLEAV
ncbi:CRE-GLA-3 protein [Caenorhabditis remanei]|uniref:CRE-GLA-3 protein n=1 Tax=Caenorhabditis remanei TaxID=31234 RepID=E3MYD3_CAERE|nr:CRE-GLA-3 protein [Caenorhabditis remanei]